MASLTTNPAAQPRTFLSPTRAAFIAFVPTGVVNVLLGPLLPALSARWSLNDAQAGELFTAQFLASTIGVLCSGALVPRFGYRAVIALGLTFMSIGVSTVPLGVWPVGIASISLYGMGFGLTIPAANLLVADANPDRKAAALNLLNFAWSIGAVACPFLVGHFMRIARTSQFLYALGAAIVLVAVLLAAAPYARPVVPSQEASRQRQRVFPLLLSPSAIALGALFFVYVGTENAVGGWLASYAQRLAANPSSNWITTPAYFYGTLLLGRLLIPLLLRTLHELKTARIGIAVALSGVVLLLVSRSVLAARFSAAVIGIGLAGIYPITVAQLSNTFGVAANTLGSVMFALAGLGAACVPWMVGALSTEFSSLKLALTVPLAGCAIMLALYLRNWTAAGPAT
jgi:FHS family glucose/mannose:H+ symporter-like MFS transporter